MPESHFGEHGLCLVQISLESLGSAGKSGRRAVEALQHFPNVGFPGGRVHVATRCLRLTSLTVEIGDGCLEDNERPIRLTVRLVGKGKMMADH